ncbi:uncharacterized protein LOC134217350 [Armigeres subalbatus]|uniref:uncharacterized protein LOC134217350 n=1 Tax=Armigeres subalbatus TaxID=124917 RepID=UPI002ED45B6A
MQSFFGLCIGALWVFFSVQGSAHFIHHGKKHFPNPKFEIFHPKGVTISYPVLWGMVGFDIRIYLNKQFPSDVTPYDICLNTTVPVNGIFIINDENAFIRTGDNLKVEMLLLMNDGCVYGFRKEFYMNDNLIYRINQTTPVSPNQNNQTRITQLEEEIKLLEGIIHDMAMNSSRSNNLYLNFRPEPAFLDPQKLHDYTLEMLQEKLPKINWTTALRSVFYYNDGIGFEMKTPLDKLKVLQMSKNLVHYTITDLDTLVEATDDDSDENSPITFHKSNQHKN